MTFKEKLSEMTSALVTTNGDAKYIRACIKVAYIQATDAWIKSAPMEDIKGRRAKTLAVINALNKSKLLESVAEETILFSPKALREDLAWFNTAQKIAEEFRQTDEFLEKLMNELEE